MKLRVFTTSRQIRKWLEDKNNQFLDKHLTIGDFFEKIIVVDNFKFIDKDLRKKYLFEAIKNVDVEKLGISREFINFFSDSDFIFSFFNELFIEKVNIDNVILNDIYQDYEEHLLILKEILKNYKTLLLKDGYIDRFLIKDYKINEGLLSDIEEIYIKLDGYLTKFDIEVLEKINKPIKIEFEVDKFNKSLIQKSFGIEVEEKKYIFDFHTKKLTQANNKKTIPIIDVKSFSDRMHQISYVFAKIKEFVEKGIKPEKIAVILPDEGFSEFLRLFDRYENLNFAMGEEFSNSNLFIKLNAIYEYKSGDKESIKKCQDIIDDYEKEDLIDFIKKIASEKELKVIDEELYKIEKFKDMFEKKEDFLFFILEKLKEKKFDDVYSGKITCMGVLESRGMEFDGVIIIDFNEKIVPSVSDNDLFLNTFIRTQSNLPTRFDKENLQKHYYYQLIQNAKHVAISYVENEEDGGSRFLYELGINKRGSGDLEYDFFNFTNKKIANYDNEFKIKFPLYPTTLQKLLECPKRYYFEKVLDITQPSEEEFFGNIFHESIKEIKFNSVEEYYKKLISKISSKINDKKLLFETLVKWDDKLKKFCKKDFEFRKKFFKSLPEQKIKFFYEGVELAAIVDRIDINDDEIVLIDYKTSKSAAKKEKYIYEFQTTFYKLWAQKKFSTKKIKTYIWDLDAVKLIEGEIKEEILKDVLKKLPNRVKEAEDIIYEDKVIKKAQDICRYCPYVVACGRDE